MKLGKLYVVATPIGNIRDMGANAIDVLRGVGLILAEDTREFRKIAVVYTIETPVKSYHNFNEHKITGDCINKLKQGIDIALVSDRGTPLISDPGYLLVREYIACGGIPKPIAGASAITTAQSISTLGHRFCFLGFVKQYKELLAFGNLNVALVIFEAPTRIAKLLDFLETHFLGRDVIFCRELTKIHEEITYGTLGKPINLDLRGEFTIIIGRAN